MRFFLPIFLLLLTVQISAQNLDSLFNKFINNNIKSSAQLSSDNLEVEKCGLPLFAQIQANFNKFSKAQQSAITARITPSLMQTSIVTPSGFFRIHYDETGIDKPEYDVNELAVALDSAYNFEVNILGYPAPPTSASILGENKYDVFVKSIGSRYYGQTFTVNSLGNEKWDTYIEINSDFSSTYTKGIDAAKVTAAHEFHHAIQMGCYIWNIEDRFYYEITSTSMEDFVYDEIDDYINYLRYYFNYPEISFAKPMDDGYGNAVWNIFLTQKYKDKGFLVIKRAWELMGGPYYQPAIQAIGHAVEEVLDDSFKNVFNKFGVWTHFTGNRSKGDKYFKGASQYPLIRALTRDQFDANSTSQVLAERTVLSQPVSNNFLLFYDNTTTNDTIYSIITNSDYIEAADTLDNYDSFSYSLFADELEGTIPIVYNKYYGKVESDRINILATSSIYNNQLVDTTMIVKKEIDYSYPQPFKLFEHNHVQIPVEPNGFGKADLYIYSSSMNLVYTDKLGIQNSEHSYVQWEGKDKNGNNVATGVYIYVTNSEDKIKKGKLVVINN